MRAAPFLLALCALFCVTSAAAQPPTPIRIEPRLLMVSAVRDAINRADYEAVIVVTEVTADGVTSAVSWALPDAKAPDGVRYAKARMVNRAEDLRSAHRLITWYLSGDTEVLPGAISSRLSRAMFDELKTQGSTAIVLGAVSASEGGVLGGLLAGRKYFRGTLARVGASSVRVLVNGVATELPAMQVKGQVAVGGDQGELELWIHDSAEAPLLLKQRFQGTESQLVRVQRPDSNVRVGGKLQGNGIDILGGATCRAELNGVYFLSGSAQLLPDSRPAIQAVAAALKAAPDWAITIEGHTDNIGTDANNLDLSKRRAEALKAELVSREGIAAARLATAGFGAKRPVDNNDTLVGRAHNRRVELVRDCKR
jgi:outer membrane protein OmpA-like peptidoglycan-associated protein